MRLIALPLLVLLALPACKEETAALPDPVPLSAETIAHYCMMNIAEHPGPKAQIFLSGLPDPIFFAQVRDAFTYLASAEQDGFVAAVYVSDMSTVSWDALGDHNWILADQATFVVGSDRVGGMGVPELVPFLKQDHASDFADRYGGTLYQMNTIPEDAYLAPVEFVVPNEEGS